MIDLSTGHQTNLLTFSPCLLFYLLLTRTCTVIGLHMLVHLTIGKQDTPDFQ